MRFDIRTHQLALSADTINAICKTVFSMFWLVMRVKFVQVDYILQEAKLVYPIRCAETTRYYQITIDNDTLSRIGHEKIKRFEYYQRHLFRDFHNAEFIAKRGDSISTEDLDNYIGAYEERARQKSYIHRVRSNEKLQWLKFLKQCGRFYALQIDGGFVAGCLCVQYDDRVILRSVTHNPLFKKYSPGIVVLYMVIKSFMNSNVRVFDFQNMLARYKINFGSQPKDYTSYVAYRNIISYALDKAFLACRAAFGRRKASTMSREEINGSPNH